MLGDGKSVILSFDDGPAPVSALESILQTLQENEIRAEFYVLGNEVEQYPEAARMIVRQGHDIQNHSWSHSDLAKAPEQDVRWELEQTQNIIEDATGIVPTKIRPPYGAGGFRGHMDPDLVEVASDLSLTINYLGYRYRGLESATRIRSGKDTEHRDPVYATATQDSI